MSDVIIIDSGANLASLEFAIERLGARPRVSSAIAEISAAPRVILPGVGSAGAAMRRLKASGIAEAIGRLEQPVLGICLGMQLLYGLSAEGGTHCLGLLDGTIERLEPQPGLPVPHMGWNQLELRIPDPLLEGIHPGEYVYFVHGYAAPVSSQTLAVTSYGAYFSAVVRRGNFWGTQFHPERSAGTGARLLANFLALT